MACLEIECTRCGWSRLGNGTLVESPQCGSPVDTAYDEADDHDSMADWRNDE